MSESSSAQATAQSAASDVNNVPAELLPSVNPSDAGKRSAAEAFAGDQVEDLKDNETTLDDVLVSPVTKKSKLLDEELPDVDDNEEFPQQEEEMDSDLAIGLENGDKDDENLTMATDVLDMGNDGLSMVTQQQGEEELAPPEDQEQEDSEPSQNNEIDIVDVDDEEEESGPGEFPQFNGQDEEEEEEDEDEQETARAIARAQNQREARQLLGQLDDSARSKLCLTALEKYGEELFYGHEDARDAILVDACAQDSVLSLVRDAIRVRNLYLRGSSAAAPVELDDDDDDEDTGGYDEEEEDGDDEEEKPAASVDDNDDDDVVIISEGEEEADNEEAPAFSPGSEGQPGGAGDIDESGEQNEHLAEGDSSDEVDEVDEETKESEVAALGDVGTAAAPIADTAT